MTEKQMIKELYLEMMCRRWRGWLNEAKDMSLALYKRIQAMKALANADAGYHYSAYAIDDVFIHRLYTLAKEEVRIETTEVK